DRAHAHTIIPTAVEELGGIDVLVNNVGGSRAGGVAELTLEDWNLQLQVNLTSVFLGCKYAVPAMQAAGGGSIINISSASGLRYTGAAQVGYASAKAAIIQLSRVTAVQYAADRVRVNTVVPGQLHTPMVEVRLAGQRAGGDVESLLTQRQSRIPIGFMGDGRDTANAALFFASDESRFVTGAEIVVDGGMTVRCD
ncbi:MAG: h16, partial [Nocardioidaceae bacterium]|nr:h16 [Nocardioidaceae bacterium]